MNTTNDVVSAPEPSSYTKPPYDLASRRSAEGADFAREINERRARVENPELLQRLRGL
jgi:hypothetical protein